MSPPKAARKKTVAKHDENNPAPAIAPVDAPMAPKAPVRNIVIRLANVRDATPLYDLLLRYFKDYEVFYPAPVPAPTMAWGLSILIKSGVLVAVENDEIIGSVGLEIGNFPWAPGVSYLNAVWFYVAPEYRDGGTAGRLMYAAKDVAIRNNMGLRMDNVWGVRPEIQDRFRRQQGFRYMGGNHVWFPQAMAPGK